MPFSISVVQLVWLPSSSTVSEPRRPGRVPSSTMVHRLDATFSPTRPMAPRSMHRHTAPTRTHSPRLAARRRRNGVEVYRGLAYCLAGVGHGPFLGLEEAVVGTPAAAETAPLPAAVVLDDDADIE